MTAETTAVSLDAIDAALAAAAGNPGEDEQRLAVAVLRLLAAGAPVSIPAAAAAAGLPGQRAEQVLRSWPAVFWDDDERVTGFWGLALPGMPHRIRRAGTDLSAWCAWDPLFLARVIGDLEVATADPLTGEEISYRIGAGGSITGASHPTAGCRSCARTSPGATTWCPPSATTCCTSPARPARSAGPPPTPAPS